MAKIMTAKSMGGIQMFIRGKLGNQVFQVKNGQQIVMQLPRKRATQPSEAELANRKRFAEVQAIYNTLTAEELKAYAKAWKAGGYKYKGKKYCTLRGYFIALAFADKKEKAEGGKNAKD